MKKTFYSYYRLSNDEFKELWSKCIFILDSNVLLNLYRYPEEVREDFFKLLSKISNRLWIPHQVALEYQENRLNVIAEQIRKFDDIENILSTTLNQLKTDIDKLQLSKRHTSIKADHLITEVEGIFKKFKDELNLLKKEQPSVFDHDPVRDKISSLLEGKVGLSPESQEQLNEIYNEGAIRYKNKQPPGYMDEDKPKKEEKSAYIYEGLFFEKKYGDLILWRQIIKEAQEKGYKYIIFITDDDKEDWWWIVDSKGKKTIGARPELVEEITTKAGVKLFYMYNTERFLQLGKDLLKVPVKNTSINQVREVKEFRKQALADILKPQFTLADIVKQHIAKQSTLADFVKSQTTLTDFVKQHIAKQSTLADFVKALPTLADFEDYIQPAGKAESEEKTDTEKNEKDTKKDKFDSDTKNDE